MHAVTKRNIGIQLTRDGVPMKAGMTVFLFDPYDDGALKAALVNEVNQMGAEVRIGGSNLCYSRNALWADRSRAEADGPPYEIYNYKKIAKKSQTPMLEAKPLPHEMKARKKLVAV